jgi:hypothetical protein
MYYVRSSCTKNQAPEIYTSKCYRHVRHGILTEATKMEAELSSQNFSTSLPYYMASHLNPTII